MWPHRIDFVLRRLSQNSIQAEDLSGTSQVSWLTFQDKPMTGSWKLAVFSYLLYDSSIDPNFDDPLSFKRWKFFCWIILLDDSEGSWWCKIIFFLESYLESKGSTSVAFFWLRSLLGMYSLWIIWKERYSIGQEVLPLPIEEEETDTNCPLHCPWMKNFWTSS